MVELLCFYFSIMFNSIKFFVESPFRSKFVMKFYWFWCKNKKSVEVKLHNIYFHLLHPVTKFLHRYSGIFTVSKHHNFNKKHYYIFFLPPANEFSNDKVHSSSGIAFYRSIEENFVFVGIFRFGKLYSPNQSYFL